VRGSLDSAFDVSKGRFCNGVAVTGIMIRFPRPLSILDQQAKDVEASGDRLTVGPEVLRHLGHDQPPSGGGVLGSWHSRTRSGYLVLRKATRSRFSACCDGLILWVLFGSHIFGRRSGMSLAGILSVFRVWDSMAGGSGQAFGFNLPRDI
jgi:hypothetical protein